MRHLLELLTISLRCIPAFFRSRSKQAIVELALRQQLATFAEKGRRPRIASADRAFWVWLSQTWSEWKGVLVIVQPDTWSAGIARVFGSTAIDLDARTRPASYSS